MRGEFGIKLSRITISKPYISIKGDSEPCFDLQLIDENGEFLYICGNNNLPQLLREALKEYYVNKKEFDKKC